MTTYNFGDVVVANVLFSHQEAAKPRPAVIISDAGYHERKPDVIIASIVSDLTCDEQSGEFILSDLSSAGLKVPSRVKAFISTIDPCLIKYSIGRFNAGDMRLLQIMLQKLFSRNI